MAKAIDIGTCFLVGAEIQNGKEVFTTERDAFFSMPNEDFAEEMLKKAGASYLTRGNSLYVVGEDALKFSLVTGNRNNFRRPMAKGVLNPGEEEAISMLEVLIEGVIGRANYEGEVVAATIPASPLDSDFNTTYHKMVLERFLRSLGYDVKIINESLAIIYSENPTMESQGATIPFTGIGISFGAGMVNLVTSWRGKKLLEFSVSRGGDWIDKEVAKVRGLPVPKVTGIKEKYLDFTNVKHNDQTLAALEIYYEDLIRYVLNHFKQEFKSISTHFDDPIEIVIGGGTASVPGFTQKFEQILQDVKLPLQIKSVRLARDPLRAVAAGALVAAIAEEKKRRRVQESAGYVAPAAPAQIYSGSDYQVHRADAAPQQTRFNVDAIPPRAQQPAPRPTVKAHEDDSAFSTAPRNNVLKNQDDDSFTLGGKNDDDFILGR